MAYERLNLTNGVDKWRTEHVEHLEDAIIANEEALTNKQPKGEYLTEHQQIKTINGQPIVGEGDIEVQPKGEYLTEHQPIKTINGQTVVGEGDIEIKLPDTGVKTVNGQAPDVNGNVSISFVSEDGSLAVDTKMSDESGNAIANQAVKNYVDYSVPIPYTTSAGYISSSTGKPQSTQWSHTNFIDVQGLSKIAISSELQTGSGALFLAYYTDADFETFMGTDTAIAITTQRVTYEDEYLVIPSEAKYAVFSGFKSLEIKVPFKMFANEVYDFMSVKNSEVAELLDDVSKLNDTAVTFTCGKNLFNKDTITTGGYLNTSNGVGVSSSEGAFYSDFMEVDGELPYVMSGAVGYWIWYDKDKNYISYNTNAGKATSPVGAKYLRVDVFNSLTLLDTIQIEVGDTATAYEAYRGVVNHRNIDMTLSLPFRVVSKDGRYGYKSISDAMADINDGGIIYVLPGEYEESVLCTTKIVHIIGTSADECILWNSTGAYATPPLFQCAGSIRNMTIKAVRDPEKTYTEENSYAIHIDNHGKDKTLEIENCIIHSDFSNTLGCGAMSNHVLTLKNNIITALTNNCFAYHLGAGEQSATVRLIGNYMKASGNGNEILFQRSSESDTERVNVLAINNAVKKVALPTPQYVLDEYSFGNMAEALNYTE